MCSTEEREAGGVEVELLTVCACEVGKSSCKEESNPPVPKKKEMFF